MTKSERIEQLEREVADLRTELALLAARTPAVVYTPNLGQGSWTWPGRPYEVWCGTPTSTSTTTTVRVAA